MTRSRRYKSRFDHFTQATLLAAIGLLALDIALRFYAYYLMFN